MTSVGASRRVAGMDAAVLDGDQVEPMGRLEGAGP